MAESTLVVEIDLDKRPAKQQAEAFRQDQQKLNQQLLTDAEVTERAKTEAIRRENQRRIAGALQTADATEKIQARTLTDAEVQEVAKTKIVERQNQRRIDTIVNAATAERAQLARVLTAEEVNFAMRDKMIKKLNDDRINAAFKAANAEKTGWGGTTTAILGALGSVVSFGAGMLGLQSAQVIISKVGESFEKARDIVLESVEGLKDYRQHLLQLAALKDQMGETTETLREQLAFRGQTLQTKEEASTFQMAMYGAGESIIDTPDRPGLMTRDEFKQFVIEAGKFQAAEGGSSETHGTLAGLIPQNAGKRLTAEEAFKKEQQLYAIFKPGAFTTFSSAAEQYQGLTPLIMNKIYGDTEAASLMSAFSTNDKKAAGTMTEWFTRATVGALGRKGAPRVEGAETIGKYLKDLGATNQLTPRQIGDLIASDMDKAEAEAKGNGLEFNAMDYLKHRGYMNMEDQKALMAYRGVRNTGQLASFMALAEKPVGPENDAAARIAMFQQQDAAGRQRRVDIGSELAKLAEAAPQEYYDQLRTRAYDVYKAEHPGQVWGDAQSYKKDWMLGGERTLDEQAAKLLLDEYKKRGGDMKSPLIQDFADLTAGEPGGDYMGPFAVSGIDERAKRFQALATQVGKLGGNILPGDELLQQRAQKALGENQITVAQPGAVGAAPPMNAQQGERLIAGVDQLNRNLQRQQPPKIGGAKPAMVNPPAVPRR